MNQNLKAKTKDFLREIESIWLENEYKFFSAKKSTDYGRTICALTMRCYFKEGKHKTYTYRADDLIANEFRYVEGLSYIAAINKKVRIMMHFCKRIDVYLNVLPEGNQLVSTYTEGRQEPEFNNLLPAAEWIRRKLNEVETATN